MPKYILLVLMSFLYTFCQETTQDFSNESKFKKVVKMTSEEFYTWIMTQRQGYEKKNEAPILIEKAVLERLKSEKYTTDVTVMAAVNAWSYYESSQEPGKQIVEDGGRFKRTISFINELIPLVSDRSSLKAKLQVKKADLYHINGHYFEAAEAYREAVNLLKPLHIDIDKMRVENMVKLAGILLASGKKSEAESIFLDVLSYPWYLITDPEPQQFLRDYYIQAGIGLIDCRRGDLEALKNTFFVPAANAKLEPILEKAIQEAESSNK